MNGNTLDVANLDFTHLVNKTLNEAINMFVATKDFVLEEIPKVLKELLMIHGLEYGFWFLFMIAVTGVIIYGIYRILKWGTSAEKLTTDMCGFIIVITIILSIISMCTLANAIGNLLTTAKIVVAPRIYLLEYAKDTFRPNKIKVKTSCNSCGK